MFVILFMRRCLRVAGNFSLFISVIVAVNLICHETKFMKISRLTKQTILRVKEANV